jgi:hypothetical protein
MRGRRDVLMFVMLAAASFIGVLRLEAASPVRVGGTSVCHSEVVEGEVRAGEDFVRPIGGGLEVRLEALPWGAGWLLRVLPVNGPRLMSDYPARDHAALATPPYASVSPLLISTDYSFRAQDAVAWNPRRFRFAASPAEFGAMASVYERYSRQSPPSISIEAELADLVSKAPEGTLQILDARLIPGTANQAQMAAMVASHFSTTAHTVEEPRVGEGSVLGKVTWLRFRISLDLPRGFKPNPKLIGSGRCR